MDRGSGRRKKRGEPHERNVGENGKVNIQTGMEGMGGPKRRRRMMLRRRRRRGRRRRKKNKTG